MANGHGGKRVGAGRPRKSLADKILEDTTKKHKPKVLNIPTIDDIPTPEPPDFLRLMVATGVSSDIPRMDAIFNQTIEWLEKTGCLHLINPQHIMEYSILFTRWLECEDVVSKSLYLMSKEKTDKKEKIHLEPNPLSDQALRYWSAADKAWSKIYTIVKENCETDYGGNDPHANIMEKLLTINREV